MLLRRPTNEVGLQVIGLVFVNHAAITIHHPFVKPPMELTIDPIQMHTLDLQGEALIR